MAPEGTERLAHHEDNVRVLALTLVGEARGESLDGRVAVAHTVRNRATEKSREAADVCLQKWQYSCWNEGTDSNHRFVMALAEKLWGTKEPLGEYASLFAECQYLAGGVLTGALRDHTKGSTHYLTIDLLHSRPPTWVGDRLPTVVLGNHAFFANIPW